MLSEGQVQFCFAVAQGNAQKANELLLRIRLIPQMDVLKQPNFQPFPAIICLWMIRQAESQSAIQQLQQIYPQVSLAENNTPASMQVVRELAVKLVFPQVKAALLPLLHNIALLAGSDDALATAVQRFHVLACTQALEFILTDPYFNDVGAHKLQIINTVLTKLRPLADQLHPETRFDPFAQIEQEKQLPYAIQRLMSILNNSPTPHPSTPKLQMEPHRYTDDSATVEQALSPMPRSYLPTMNCRAHAQRLEALAFQLTRDNLNRADIANTVEEEEPSLLFKKPAPRPVF